MNKNWWGDDPAEYFSSPSFEALVNSLTHYFKRKYQAYEGLVEDAVFRAISDFVISVFQNRFSLGQFKTEAALRSFLRRRCIWKIREFAKTERRRNTESLDALGLLPRDNQTNEGREIIDAMREEIDKLPQSIQTILKKYYVNSESLDSIADSLGISSRTVRRRLFQGRKLIRKALWRRGFFENGG